MLTAEARVGTDRASQYLAQLCRHARQMGQHTDYRPRAHGGDAHRPFKVHDVESSDTHGIVRLSLGQWTLQATPEALLLRAQAASKEDLERMQDLIAARLEKIGRRDGLSVSWQRSETSGDQPGEVEETESSRAEEAPRPADGAVRRWSLRAVAGIAALLVVGHLVLGGSVLAASQWLGWGAGVVVLVVVVVKVIGLGGLAARHGHRHRRRERV